MIQYKGGNGSSKQESIIILGAINESEGVEAEYNYLDSRYSQYELISQELIDEVSKQYDILYIRLPNGEEREVWIDITGFYGN